MYICRKLLHHLTARNSTTVVVVVVVVVLVVVASGRKVHMVNLQDGWDVCRHEIIAIGSVVLKHS